ncbi:unnamed protein product [Paramecium sonneborni]|uniref:Uncharacterized protein n=1 Tax=Paramecium sonneborni TaxID=65129 RepID=A0A8S1M5D0_9CILI|nr:unnamed protein product [Paramecium sonneborni]
MEQSLINILQKKLIQKSRMLLIKLKITNLKIKTQIKSFRSKILKFANKLDLEDKRYELDFLPFLISVQVSLYHVCKLLTPWYQVEIKKQPFSSFTQMLLINTFPEIKISQLP